jgi:hypothetical protein
MITATTTPLLGTCTIQHGCTAFDSIPRPPTESIDDLTSTNERTRASERTSKYTAPPNPQGDRPRSMRSLAINYRVLPGSLDNTVRFSCLLSRSGDPWRGSSDWGLGTKDTQAHTHIPLAFWYSGSLWMNPPYAFDRP